MIREKAGLLLLFAAITITASCTPIATPVAEIPTLTSSPRVPTPTSATSTPDIPETQSAERLRQTVQAYQTETAAEKATERAAGTPGAEATPAAVTIRPENASELSLAGELETDTIAGAVFSPDGRYAVLLVGEQLQVIDLEARTTLATLPGEALGRTAFSPAELTFAAALPDGEIYLFPGDEQEALTLPAGTGSLTALAFTADGSRLLSASTDGSLKVWGAPTGAELQSIDLESALGTGASINRITFSDDGAMIALFFENESALWIGSSESLFDGAPEGDMVAWLDHAGPVADVWISPDWETLAWISRGTLQLMTAAGELIGDAIHHEDWIANPTFYLQQNLFLVTSIRSSEQGMAGVVLGYSLGDGSLALELTGPDWISAFSRSPAGGLAAAGTVDGQMRLWDLATGEAEASLAPHTGMVQNISFSAGGDLIASSGEGGALNVSEVRTGETLSTIDLPPGVFHWMRFDASGRWLVVILETGTILFFGVEG